MRRTVSTRPTEATVDSARAWLNVVATFASSFVTLGTAYSFGAFFEPMAEEFNSTRGQTAIIFGITTFLFFWLSILTGSASDRWGPKPVLLFGATAMLVGLVATSRVNSLALGYVTYGAGVGIAAACGYIPLVATVGGWFDRQRATAIGISVAGIGAGTLVMSPVSAALIKAYGWRDTYVILGVAGAIVLGVATLLVDRPPNQTNAEARSVRETIRSPDFAWLHLSALCSGLALFVPFVFVGQYAKDAGVGSVEAAALVGVLGGASILARIGFGTLVARFGSLALYKLSFVILAASFVIWLAAGSSYGLLVVFVAVLGIGYGAFVALSTIVMAERMGTVGLGSTLGLFYTSQGLGGLIGPPAAGWLIDATDSYRPVIVGCVALELAARLLLQRLSAGRPLATLEG